MNKGERRLSDGGREEDHGEKEIIGEGKLPGFVPLERLAPVKIVDSPEPPGWKVVPDNRVKRPDGSLWDPDTGLIQYPDGRLEHDLVYRTEIRKSSKTKEEQ